MPRFTLFRFVLLSCGVLAAPAFAFAADAKPAAVTFPADAKIDFVKHVQPILQSSCVECHSADVKKGRLRLDAKQFATAGGQSGAIIKPGDVAGSLILRRVRGEGGEQRMPFKRPALPDDQIRILTSWIEQGAAWPDGIDGEIKEEKVHWSFVKPVAPSMPSVTDVARVRNPIDAFIVSRLEKEGLSPSAEADRAALIRRVTFDLIGLPPSLSEVDAFVADKSPDAYEKLVDRLLASPHYGERWARQWLDIARYADTNGYEKDRARNIYPYRDWVIAALNRNMPFDRFTVEQIAGDLLPNPTPEQIIATGFHRNTLWNEEGGVDLEEFRFKAIVDRVETTSAAWLGLTLQCAQCHTHKYDPVTHKEYYGIFAMLNNADEPEYSIPDAAVASKRAAIEAEAAKLEANLENEFPADEPEMAWAALKPINPKAASGATVSASGDDVVLVNGASGATDTYTLRLRGELAGATAIRLEALTDPSLPNGGPGRAVNGNFVLSEVKLATVSKKRPKAKKEPKPVQLVLSGAKADVSQAGYDIAAAIDGNASTGWGIDDGSGSLNKNRAATFHLAAPLGDDVQALEVTLEHAVPNHALGKFRIAAGRPKAGGSQAGESLAERRQHRLNAKLAEWEKSAAAKSGRWTVVRPTNMNSRGKATMVVQPDGAVLVSGDAPNNDLYTVDVETPLAGVTAIKLEVLPDESLPENGPGRAPLFMPGDFLLSEFEVKAGAGSAKELQPVKLRGASQNFASANRTADLSIDGRIDTGWSIGPKTGQAHQAVFVLPQPVGGQDGTKLSIALVQQYIHQTTIGRFRISVTTDAQPAPASDLPPGVEAILATTTGDSRTPEQRELLKQYFLFVTPDLTVKRQKIAELRKSMPQLQRTMVMRERLPEHARVTHLMHRGEFLQPRDPVGPGVPGVLHPMPADAPRNRLGLAQWLIDPNNPLVGRVVMNRSWAALFGRGIVNTVQDFGLMGEKPSHPELLDWLATEFVRSGWDVKHMHRLMVTSSTYRQDNRVTPDLLARDANNVMLARGPRNRVEAEMVRDLALSVSGLLDGRIGGPSVFPPQPDGASDGTYGMASWPTSTGADRWRRGLYTYLKRMSPYPAMLTFDAPSADTTCVRRVKTNTPLQALTLLNDKVFVEASQALARRVLKEAPPSGDARTKLLFRLCTGRAADAEELAQLDGFIAAQLERFKTGGADANAVATSEALPAPTDANLPELAAWTVAARAMLNLDETITK